MAKSHNQKAKILYLARMLRESGENHVLSMQDILAVLTEYGIQAERKSIYDDMETLRDFGMDVRFKRGRPGGYYLAGQTEANGKSSETKNSEENIFDSDRERWKFSMGETTGEKPMKLLCSSRMETEVKLFFGDDAEYKDKGQGFFTVTAKQLGNPQFFGWLTAMGREVHIVKPKKLAQAYRDYLKSLAKEYKGI